MGLTDQQYDAVTARNVSVALSAGAGCGKTFVLTRRFLSHLEPQAPGGPARLNELAAITFTERAAREMRDRIRGACRGRLRDAPEAEVDHWMNLIRQLDSARISTIHSFCGRLLRSHAVEAGIDPRFVVLDAGQADVLRFELLDDELRRRLADRDEGLLGLVLQFGLNTVRDCIETLVGGRTGVDWAAWREAGPEELVERWETYRRDTLLPRALRGVAESEAASRLLAVGRTCVPTHAKMRDRMALLVEQLPTLDTLAALEAIRDSAKVQGGGGAKAWPSEEVYQEVRDAAKDLRDAIKGVAELGRVDLAETRRSAETCLDMFRLADVVVAAYEARKGELAAVDFDDLMLRAAALLRSDEQEALRRRLAEGTALLLVDECQDTDPLQVELIKALCGRRLRTGRLFFVGDYKQSIYRFRGADPDVFRRLQEEMPPAGRLPLTLNFRSQPAVIEFVNAMFCDCLGPDYEPLEAHRPQVARLPAIEFLWSADEEPDVRTGQAARLRRGEADWIGRRIRGLLDSEEPIVYDESASRESGEPVARRVQAGDIAILFRALSDIAQYEEALQRYGIDYYLVGGKAFYAQQEVFDVLNLLRSLDSRADEVSLVGVLRSPMFALQDETLFWLAQHADGLHAGLNAPTLPAELSEPQRRRAVFAATTLERLRELKDRLPTAGLLREAIRATGYDAILLGEFLGTRKLANLHKLVDQARGLDRAGMFTLSDFLTRLSRYVAREPDEPLAATMPESTDVVRLMTIHKSKGLEFPVVFVADVDRQSGASRAPAAMDAQLGPVVKTGSNADGFALFADRERLEDAAERDRLFYVATTRAADLLILSSGVRSLGTARGPWMKRLAERFDPLTGELRATLPDGFPVPAINVTTEKPPLEGKTTRRKSLDLLKCLDDARALAGRGGGRVPAHLEAIAPDATARRQFSFSRLAGTLHAPEPASTIDDDDDTVIATASMPRLDPLGLGTLVHAVLDAIDFRNPPEDDALRHLLALHAEQHLPNATTLAEPLAMLRGFLASARAAALASARRIHPEIEFLLAWPLEGEPDGRFLQGFIDCLYEDTDGGWHLLDYKTNRVTPKRLATVAAPYEMQMLIYATAAHQILGQPPVELVLHFLRAGIEQTFPYTPAARRRGMELVERGLTV